MLTANSYALTYRFTRRACARTRLSLSLSLSLSLFFALSSSSAVAVERSSISAMYKYKPELFEEAYAKGVLQQHKLGGEKGWSDEGMAGVMATSSAKTEP